VITLRVQRSKANIRISDSFHVQCLLNSIINFGGFTSTLRPQFTRFFIQYPCSQSFSNGNSIHFAQIKGVFIIIKVTIIQKPIYFCVLPSHYLLGVIYLRMRQWISSYFPKSEIINYKIKNITYVQLAIQFDSILKHKTIFLNLWKTISLKLHKTVVSNV
jgi:hypothetical protein